MLLSVLDRKWREHLYEMDYLREGIGLRAYSQRDPLVEYQREGFDLFSAMMDSHQGGVGRLPLQRRGAGRAEDAAVQDAAAALVQVRSPTAGRSPRLRPPTHDDHRPHIRREGSRGTAGSAEADLLGAVGRRRRGHDDPGRGGRGRVRGRLAQRAVPVRLRQEVQALPRRPRQPREALLTGGLPRRSRAVRLNSHPPTRRCRSSISPSSRAVQSHRPRTNSSLRRDGPRPAAGGDPRGHLGRVGRRLPDVHGGDLLPGRPDLSRAAVAGDPFAPVAEVGVDRGDGPTRELGQRSVAAHHLQDRLDEPRGPRMDVGHVVGGDALARDEGEPATFGVRPPGRRAADRSGRARPGCSATPVTRRPATSGDSQAPGWDGFGGWVWSSQHLREGQLGSGEDQVGSGPTRCRLSR